VAAHLPIKELFAQTHFVACSQSNSTKEKKNQKKIYNGDIIFLQ
jgi:hypothetical protein